MRRIVLVFAVLLALPMAPASGARSASLIGGDCTGTSVGFTPLDDLGAGKYEGRQGGLYPGGSNERPPAHDQAGRDLAAGIEPLDSSGLPDPSGRYALLSIGMSNTTQEFSVFKQWADADPRKDPRLVIVDGAQGGAHAGKWSNPNDPVWQNADQRLAAAGVTPQQVVAAWVKVANPGPSSEWPEEAERLREQIGRIARNLKARYPNVALSYVSSRIYAGYASTALNPEPYAYESGFGAKWVVQDQIEGDPQLNHDPGRGDVMAPWLAWGSYLWADGLSPRSDGLTWGCDDFTNDGTHPSQSGREKVAGLLLEFFTTDATTTPWFGGRRPEIDDAVGDANYVNNHGVDQIPVPEHGPDTRPVSIGSADLISAWYETGSEVVRDRDEDGSVVRVRHVPTALRVHLETASPAAPSFGPTVSFDVWVNVGACSLIFRTYVRGAASLADDPPQSAELRTRKTACAEGPRTYTDGITLSLDGRVATMEFPFEALGPKGTRVLGAGDVIEADADGTRSHVSTVHRPQPGGALLGGPVIDVAPPTLPFVIGSDLPPDIDCMEAEDHPECEG